MHCISVEFQNSHISTNPSPCAYLLSYTTMPPIHRLARASKHISLAPLLLSSRQTRCLSTTTPLRQSHNLHDPPKGETPQTPGRGPPSSPPTEAKPDTYLGTTTRLPEFTLLDRVVLVSGGARGLGLTQAEALLEAGATVYALDRLPEPSPDFYRVQARAASELGTTLLYRQIDVRDQEMLGQVVGKIGAEHGRMDGLVAAAGIQQETPALEYTARDANLMFEINITGTLLTAQAVAREMIKYGKGGSMVLIASMSGSVANRVCSFLSSLVLFTLCPCLCRLGV